MLFRSFNSRNQQADETNECYIRELNHLIEKCNFGTQNDDQLKYRLLTGMTDKELSLDLQQLPDAELTLSRVITGMRAKENIQQGQRDVDAIQSEQVHAVAMRSGYMKRMSSLHYAANSSLDDC